MTITQERLEEVLDYNPDTGVFRWRVARLGVRENTVAGCIYNTGYRVIVINRERYLAHRLAWLYVHGYMPEPEIDHRNGNRDDNRLANLRQVSRTCNARNCKIPVNNRTGVKGVSFYRDGGPWRATIGVGRKMIHLGIFERMDDAVMARWEGEKKHNFPNCQTTSSAYKYLCENNLL